MAREKYVQTDSIHYVVYNPSIYFLSQAVSSISLSIYHLLLLLTSPYCPFSMFCVKSLYDSVCVKHYPIACVKNAAHSSLCAFITYPITCRWRDLSLDLICAPCVNSVSMREYLCQQDVVINHCFITPYHSLLVAYYIWVLCPAVCHVFSCVCSS